MKPASGDMELQRRVTAEDGFPVYILSNRNVEVSVVPELGARILSLKNLVTGREWMWHPAEGLKLFRNKAGDDFSLSTLAGTDECVPTIAPCEWQGRALPDHGEVWTAAWELDEDAWQGGMLRTSVTMKVSPFDFSRTIELRGNELTLSYRLDNRGTREESYLWAMHPLLRLYPGDRLLLPASTRALLDGESWIGAIGLPMPDGTCSKLFARPISEGFAGIENPVTADRLDFAWDASRNNALGLWRTCGGWNGHDHFAMEPANADTDSLREAAKTNRCGAVAAGGSKTWEVRIRLGPPAEQ